MRKPAPPLRRIRPPLPLAVHYSGLFLLLLSFALVFPLSSARADSAAGSTAASFLELGSGARAAAMGNAYAAWSDDVYGLYFNPAGPARIRRKELGFVHNTLFQDLSYSYLGYLHPLGSRGTLGLNAAYVDLGSVQRTTIASGQNNQTLGTASGSDWMVGLSYSRPLRSFLDLGVTLKVLQEKLDDASATAFAADFGALFHPPVRGLTVGLSLANLGTRLQFDRDEEELPLTLRTAVGYRTPNERWGLSAEMDWTKNQEISGSVGGEFWILPRHLAFRTGFNSGVDVDNGFSAGAAFRWNDLTLDYAFVPFGELGDQHQVSLTYDFGAERTLPGGAPAPVPEDQAPSTRSATTPVYQPSPPVRPDENWIAPQVTGEAPALAYVFPFTYQSGPEEHQWLSEGFREIFWHDWRKAGVAAAAPNAARFQLKGDYWVVGDIIIVTANLYDEGYRKKTFQWRGDVNKIWPLFEAMRKGVNAEIPELQPGY